jgi:hypothetical protein
MMSVFCSLVLSWLLALWLVVLHLFVLLLRCHLPHLRLLLLLLVVRVVVFIVLTLVTMDMWRRSATGRRKLRLTVLHRVLVVLVLETQKILILFRHLVASTSIGVVGTVTQSSALIGSTTAS